MSKLYELLKTCEVEWKSISEVVSKIETIKFQEDLADSEYEYIDLSSVNRETNQIVRTTTINRKTAPSRAKQIVATNDILFGGTRPMLKRIAFIDERYDGQIASTGFTVLRVSDENLLPRFLYYLIQTNKYFEYIQKVQKGASYPSVSDIEVKAFKIPIPPLSVQEEIVKILDKTTSDFKSLISELKGEISLREKQYAYYRDLLLSAEYIEKEVSDVPKELTKKDLQTVLGKVGEFIRGNGLQKKDFTEEGFPVIHYGQIYTKYGFSTDKTFSFVSKDVFTKLKKAQPNDIIMATTSENIEDVGKAVVWLGNQEIGISGDSYIYTTNQNSKYIAYYFQSSHFQKQKEKKVTGIKVIRINSKAMNNFSITIPPVNIQEKIVRILDRFSNDVDSITRSLKNEIILREKQYKYYRDKLLSFREG